MSVTVCTAAGSRAMNAGVNQRGTTMAGQRRHALGADQGGPVVPRLRARQRGQGGAADREGGDPLRGVRRQPDAGHPAQRDARVGEPVDAVGVGEREHVAAEVGDRVRAGRGGRLGAGCAVAACLVPQHPEMARQHGQLVRPDVAVGADRVAEHQHRRVGGARRATRRASPRASGSLRRAIAASGPDDRRGREEARNVRLQADSSKAGRSGNCERMRYDSAYAGPSMWLLSV